MLTSLKNLSLLLVIDKQHVCAYLQPFQRYTPVNRPSSKITGY